MPAKPFHNLRTKMPRGARRRAAARTQAMLEEMPLHELRQALELTQEEIAHVLKVKQAAVSKLERRTDMYISTLARFIAAMGGKLELNARFPNGKVRILSLADARTGKGVRRHRIS